MQIDADEILRPAAGSPGVLSAGVRAVGVNGVVVLDGGDATGEYSEMVSRRAQP